ncbi:coiled-coil protein [Legionella hackeliae]|nr:hypothetical protein [Legionella hackeliae]STX48735.1 coiled-coil protein [Legionella hackeliae]
MSVGLSINELEARLPELEWQMSSLGHSVSTKMLPKGLFRLPDEASPSAFIDDIKTDLKRLSDSQNTHGSYYLAQRIRQKINVLVGLCRLEAKQPSERQGKFYLNVITSRQNFVGELEKEISLLAQQRQAILNRLEQVNVGLQLTLKAELG